MKKIVVISLVVIVGLLLALAIGCGGSKNPDDLEGKIGWNEDYPAIYLFSKSGPPEQAYKVYVKGQATNLSKDRLNVPSLVIRLYNSAGEKLYEEIFDRSWSPDLYPGNTLGTNFSQYLSEGVTHYDVIVTDSQGKEYTCASAVSVAKGEMAESLEGKIKWVESEYNPFTCVYHQDVPQENPYEVNINGVLVNVSQENVNVASLIFRFYNQADEKLSFYNMTAGEMRDEIIVDHNFLWAASVLLRPGEEGWGAIFNQFFAEEVVRYEVFITDSQGNEYDCIR
jgi:hypothetical protein